MTTQPANQKVVRLKHGLVAIHLTHDEVSAGPPPPKTTDEDPAAARLRRIRRGAVRSRNLYRHPDEPGAR